MYGDGSPWYVDSWAKDVQATPGYELVVGNLMSEIRKQACRLKSVSPCGVPTKYTVKQSDPLLTAYLNLRIAPLGRFYAHANAKCAVVRYCNSCKVVFGCWVDWHVKDPFDFDSYDWYLLELLTRTLDSAEFVLPDLYGFPRNKFGGTVFDIHIRWSDSAKGVLWCCRGGS
jgi:hypothetical protein